MTFTQQIIATLIGSFCGFLGALIMLWIKLRFDESQKEQSIAKNLHFELDYNINLLGKFRSEVTKCIEAISNDIKEVYLTIDYELIGHYFSLQFYREGLVTKYLHVEDVKRWNDFLSTLCKGSETYPIETVGKWRNNEVSRDQVFKALNQERDKIQYACDLCGYLKQKIVR